MGHNLIVTPFFQWKVIGTITRVIEHVQQNVKVKTDSTIYTVNV